MKSAVCLLSGGLDSTVNFLLAKDKLNLLAAITFDYGQKAAKKELQAAGSLCKKFGIKHIIVEVPFFKDFTHTSLVFHQANIPSKTDINLDSSVQNEVSAERVWVPNRNGIFLNIAAGYAEGFNAKYIIPGFNLEEAATFPDNSQNYQDALKAAFKLSTRNHVEVLCYTQNLVKKDILKLGLENKLNIKDLWPCYHGKESWCLDCESCLRFIRAAESNGLTIPN